MKRNLSLKLYLKLLLVVVLTVVMISMAAIFAGCQQPPKTYEISGEITKVEYIAEGSSFNAQDILVTIVRFKDGRVKSFNGISGFTFKKGIKNTVTYNSRGYIVGVTF